MLKIAAILSEEKKNETADILKGPITKINSHTNTPNVQSEYKLYIVIHIFAQMEICKFFQSRERSFECLERLIPQLEKMNEPAAQDVLRLLKMAIAAFKKDLSKTKKVFDEELVLTKDKGYYTHDGNMHLGKGAIYLSCGDYINACDMFEKALPLYERAGDLNGQGAVYMLWGTLYRSIGDDIRALDMFDKALPFLKKAGEAMRQCLVFRKKAEIFEHIGERSKAIEMYDNALKSIETTKYNQEKADTYLAKGIIYQKTGDRVKAREMYNHALALFENEQDPVDKRNAYQAKGKINSLSGNYSDAIKMYEKSIPFYTEFGHFGGEGDLYKTMGELHFLTGNYSKAMAMYDRALQHYKKLGVNEMLSHTLHRKAQTLEKLGKNDNAMAFFEQAIEKLETIRRKTGFPWMKMFLMEKVYDQYIEAVVFMLDNGYCEKGFKYAEAMTARVFLDRLAEGLEKLDKELPPGLRKHRDKLLENLSNLSGKIYETGGEKDEKTLQGLKEQYRKAENEFEELLIKIRLEHRSYASVRYPEPISVQSLQKEVLKEGELLLRYFVAPEKLYVFLVSKNHFNVFPLNINKKKLDGLVDNYSTALKENDSRRLRRFGKRLYEALILPLERRISENQTIIFAPDGTPATIPFESFIIDWKESGQPVYLVEKYRIKYIQSASVLSILREHYHRDGKSKRFIGFGDPVYDYESFKRNNLEHGTPNPVRRDNLLEIHRGKYHREGGKLVRLKGSGEEVETIAGLFKNENQRSVLRLRAAAAEENAKAPGMKDFDFIHFACHGILADSFQSLVLSQRPPEKSSEDGYFTLNEIMNCDYNAKLVVLSGCETGSGKMGRAEGVTGLTRAMMYAGTPAVVASLWKVDDRATKELMVIFYRNMLEKNMDKVEALRQAKLELLKTQAFSSPYFWSAFIMYGE